MRYISLMGRGKMRLKETLRMSPVFIGVLIFSLLIDGHAKNKITYIWQIGKGNVRDFVPQKDKVIEYQVPKDWYELLYQDDPNWGKFPLELYSEGAEDDKPQEVVINFDYPEDYGNPTLVIRASKIPSWDWDIFHNLIIYKGEEVEIGSQLMGDSTFIFVFSLGFLKRGDHKENRIIIKVLSPASDIPIFFDSLWLILNKKDSDDDGVSNEDEGNEEISNDKTTASIPIRSYDPNDIERITLHIEVSEGSAPCFQGVRFLDANALNLPEQIISSLYFPYGFLDFRVEEIEPLEQVVLKIGIEDRLYPSVRFYTYQDTNEWEETDHDILDAHSAGISLSDGGTGDFDGKKNGSIHTRLFIAYPRGLGIHLEKTGCFIEGILSDKR